MSYGLEILFDPGQLDNPLTLKKRSSGVFDAYNQETITWSDVQIMGKFEYMSGRESTDAGKETTYLRGRLIIRHYPTLTAEDYFVIDSKDWDIETIGNYGKDGMYNMIYLRQRT